MKTTSLSVFFILICGFTFAQVPAYIPTSGLIAYYPFNSSVNNVYGTGDNGIIYGGVTYGADRFGTPNSCYVGNGASGVDIPGNNFPTGNAARSVSVWFKERLPYSGGNMEMFAWGDNSANGNRFGLGTNSTDLFFEAINCGNQYTSPNDSAWHNFVVTYPSAGAGTASIKIYLDGVITSSTVFTPVSPLTTDTGFIHCIGTLMIPVYWGSWLYSWVGSLDDIGVWDRELTPCEIWHIYAGTTVPPAITGPNTVCIGGTINLSDPMPGGTWSSSNTTVATISGTGVVSGISSGTTIISYIAGCIVAEVITVGTLPPITGGNTMCPSSTLQLSDATAGGVWSSDNTTVATISGTGFVTSISSGTTNISYTIGGYSAGEVLTVGGLQSITGDSSVCAGATTSLSDATGGGTWSSSNTSIAIAGVTTGIVSGLAPGFAWITYTAGGCTTQQLVTVSPSPDAGTITGPPDVCVSSTITLSDNVSGGVWGISNNNATLSGNSITGVSAGTDTVSYTVTSAMCGTATVTAVINIDLSPDAGIISGDSTVCPGATVNLSDPMTGGVWGSSNSTVATVSAGVVYARSAGSVTIGYAVTNACGIASTTYKITVFPSPPNSPIAGQDSACVDAVFMLSDATPGGHWSNTNTTVLSLNDSGKVSALSAGTATIIYTTGPNAGGCSSSVNFEVTISLQGSFVVNSIVIPVSCYGETDGSIHLSTMGAQTYQYLWNNGVNGTVLTGLAPGYDTVSIIAEATQCHEVHIYYITQPDSLEVTASSKNDTCDAGKGSANVDVTGGTPPYTYHWSDNKTAQNNTSLVTGTYSVTVTDANGCTKSVTATVHQDTCNAIIIHNVITPNGDGINDTWVIEGIQNYPENTVQIFDKWGNMVYSKTNYDNNWNGGKIPDGTYYYLVKLNEKNLKGSANTWTGSLLIKR